MTPHDGVTAMAKVKATTCGAKTRAGTPCKQPHGWGTDHLGEGRCKLHGGATPRGSNSPHFVHGRRSRYFDPNSIVGFAEWRASVGAALDLEEDLLAMIYIARESLLRQEPVMVMTRAGPVEMKPGADYLTQCMVRIAQCVEKLWKKKDGITVHLEVTPPQVEAMFREAGRIIGRRVKSKEARALIAEDFAALRDEGRS